MAAWLWLVTHDVFCRMRDIMRIMNGGKRFTYTTYVGTISCCASSWYSIIIVGRHRSSGRNGRACVWRVKPFQVKTHALVLEKPPRRPSPVAWARTRGTSAGRASRSWGFNNLNTRASFPTRLSEQNWGRIENSDSAGMECLILTGAGSLD